jgi:hypothetical protein
MVRSRRTGHVWSLVVLLAAGALASCATYRDLVAHPAPGSSAGAPDWHATQVAQGSHRVLGYRTSDGAYHDFEGTVRLVGDSLQFRPVAGGSDKAPVVLPASEVTTIKLFATPAVGVLMAAALVGVMATIAIFFYGL